MVWGKPGDEVGEGREEGDDQGDREREAHFEVEERSPCLGRLLPRGVRLVSSLRGPVDPSF